MNSKDVSNLLVAVGLLNSLIKQAAEVSALIERSPGGLSLADLKVIVDKRDASLDNLDVAIQEQTNGG